MAAAAQPGVPAPQNLHIIAVTIDMAAADRPLQILANEKLVSAIPFVPWLPTPGAAAGAPATVQISQFRAAKAFLRRCSLGQTAADHAAFQTVNSLTFGLNEACWGRLLSALHNAHLFDSGPFLSWASFLKGYRNIDLTQIDLTIHHTDLDLGEPFDNPGAPAVAAVPGRRGVPAIPAVAAIPPQPGPPELLFLSMVTLDQLEGANATEPMGLWADLIGCLGPCHTDASRTASVSTVQINALLISRAISSRLLGPSGGQAPHPLLAINVLDLIRDAALPLCLVPAALSDSELRSELRDGLRYIRSDAERRAVEISRIDLIEARYSAASLCTISPPLVHASQEVPSISTTYVPLFFFPPYSLTYHPPFSHSGQAALMCSPVRKGGEVWSLQAVPLAVSHLKAKSERGILHALMSNGISHNSERAPLTTDAPRGEVIGGGGTNSIAKDEGCPPHHWRDTPLSHDDPPTTEEYVSPQLKTHSLWSGYAHGDHRCVYSAPTYYVHVGSKARTKEESAQLVDRLLHGRTSAAGINADATLTAKLEEVEKLLLARLAAVTEFAGRPGATAASVVDALLAERASAQAATAGANGATDEGDDNNQTQSHPESDAILCAINQDSFRAMAAQIAAADVDTAKGRTLAFVKGFSNQCVLSIRVLCEGSATLARRHNALRKLHQIRRHLPEYLSWSLAADDKGNVPSRLADYSILGPVDATTGQPNPAGTAFYSKLLRFDLQTMDWLFAPGGLLALKAARDGGLAAAAKVHPLDIYTIPGIVRELGAMVHQLLCAMGAAKEDTNTALTFASWTDIYLDHLAATSQLLDDDSKIAHLDRCHGLFALGLKVAGDRMAEAVYTVQPDVQTNIPPFFPIAEDPVAHVRAWSKRREASLDAMIDHRGLFPTPPAASSSNSRFNNPWVLPLRSECRKPAGELTHDTKRKAPDDGPHPTKFPKGDTGKDRQELRSLVAAHLWIIKDKELFVSGKVWRVRLVAKKLGVDWHKYCWPVLLNACTYDNHLAHCEHRGAPGHESAGSAAHHIDKFSVKALVADSTLWRYPGEQEKAKLRTQMEQAGLQIYADKGIPKEKLKGEDKVPTTRSRGRGRGRGRPNFR